MVTAKSPPPFAPGEVRAYPVLPLRDIVVFPHMIASLFVGREKSIRALEKVTQSDTSIPLATQKHSSDDDPATNAIFEVRTLASVLEPLRGKLRGSPALIACLVGVRGHSVCRQLPSRRRGKRTRRPRG